MVYTYGTRRVPKPPIVDRLRAVFDSLPDSELLARIEGPTRRGPKGWPVEILWRCVLTRYVLNLRSTAELLRQLQDNPFICEAIGLEWPNLPHEATLSRFVNRIAADRYTLAKLKDISRQLVRRCYETIPGFGKRVAIDGSVIKGWANGAKAKRTDADAGWAVKQGTQGVREYTFGWKLHLAVDCETELPMGANISAGNVHDSQRATNVMGQIKVAYNRFSPDYVICDPAYNSPKIDRTIKKFYGGQPIIKTNKAHRRRHAKAAWLEATPQWKALYAQRGAVERVFGRLKGQYALNYVRTRGIHKVTAHCYLSLIAMQVSAVSSRHDAEQIRRGESQTLLGL